MRNLHYPDVQELISVWALHVTVFSSFLSCLLKAEDYAVHWDTAPIQTAGQPDIDPEPPAVPQFAKLFSAADSLQQPSGVKDSWQSSVRQRNGSFPVRTRTLYNRLGTCAKKGGYTSDVGARYEPVASDGQLGNGSPRSKNDSWC